MGRPGEVGEGDTPSLLELCGFQRLIILRKPACGISPEDRELLSIDPVLDLLRALVDDRERDETRPT
jgi:hypothetical protein